MKKLNSTTPIPFAALAICILACSVMAGWVVQSSFLVQLHPDFSPMQFNTALCFLLCGFAIAMLGSRNSLPGIIAACIASLLALATLLQYIFHANYGIDTLFITPFTQSNTAFIGRMAPNTASAFVLLAGTIVLCASQKTLGDRRALFAALLSSLACALGLVPLLGYMSGVDASSAWDGVTQMALHTSLCFIVLSVCLLVQTWSQSTGARLWLPAPVFLGAMTIAVSLALATYDAHPFLFIPILAIGLLTSLLLTLSVFFALKWRYQNNSAHEHLVRLNSMIDTALDGIIVIDDRGIVETFNPECERIFGYRASEVVGKNLSMLMPEPHAHNHDQYIDNYRRTGISKFIGVRREMEGRRKDGTLFPLDLAVSEVQLKGRRVFSGILRDITERRLLEFERLKLVATIEESSDYIGMADTEGRLQYHNRSARLMIGLAPDYDLSKMRIADMHPAWAVRMIQEEVLPIVFATGSWKGENALLHRDGREIPVLQTIVLHCDAAGNPAYLTTIMKDISQKKQADATRERLIEQLTAMNEQLEQFAYVASHDLREPLRTIVSFSSLLEESLGKTANAEAKEYMAITRSAACKMESLITDLLDYSRLTHEAERLVEVDCNVELVHALEMLREAIEYTGATIEVSPLPRVHANAPRFIRLLQNLIGNGLKYQPPGNTPLIRISAEDKGDHWLFMVADNGIGIAPEFAEHIFLPFKRLHGQSEFVGSGIGLAICRRIVEGFGGRIYVESEPGRGSRFFFTMPKH